MELIANKKISENVLGKIAEALGHLGEKSLAGELVRLLTNEQIGRSVRGSIAGTIETLAHDETVVQSLAKLLPNSDIAKIIHRVLWTLSRRFGVRIFMVNGADGRQIRVAKWG